MTFNNGRKLKEVVEAIPLTSIVLETDSPYLSPVPFRGKRNSALNIPYVAKEIAALKGVTEEEVYDVTFRNSLKLYRMEEKFPNKNPERRILARFIQNASFVPTVNNRTTTIRLARPSLMPGTGIGIGTRDST